MSCEYSVAVIGLGTIGYTYDSKTVDDLYLTHIKSILKHKKFSLKCVVDTDASKLEKISLTDKSIRVFQDWNELELFEGNIDVCVVSLPTSLHYKCLSDLILFKNIKYFFVEKPLFESNEQYNSFSFTSKRDIIIVNYIRRLMPSYISMQKDISSGRYGKIQKVVGCYSKGLSNNGSHLIDTVRFLTSSSASKGKLLCHMVDYNALDPSVDALVEMSNGDSSFLFHMIALDERKYSIFDITIFTDSYKLELVDFGRELKVYETTGDEEYSGYNILNPISTSSRMEMDKVMLGVYDTIGEFLDGAIDNPSSLDNELENRKLINNLTNQIQEL